jgi:hypothetical protein
MKDSQKQALFNNTAAAMGDALDLLNIVYVTLCTRQNR